MEYHKIVLAHRIVVSLFLLHYVIKLVLLLLNKSSLLSSYTAKTKVLEMIISVLFLASGIYLVYAGPSLHFLQIIKIICVFASIPLAVIGFKKSNKFFAGLSVLLLVASYGLAEVAKKKQRTAPQTVTTSTEPTANQGKELYTQLCVRCHGDNGAAMIAGAKNLQESLLDETATKNIIKNGQNTMPAFETLTDEQLNTILAYTQTLKQ